MNYNILSYSIYALITCYVIIWVGKLFHRNGRIFILSLFQNREDLTNNTNNLLLIAYYLFNIGYAILQFSYWETIKNVSTMISSIATKTGILILILAALHYNNMFIIYLLSNKNKKINKSLNQ
ncbi:MAG TPA: hypothetical protein VKY32_00405 [Flavobacterium sp.]|nr:hypothetical protein [Flavobacterium sp.]